MYKIYIPYYVRIYMDVEVIGLELAVYICMYIVPSQPPRRIIAQNVSATAAHLVWSPPEPRSQNGPIISYTVSYHTQSIKSKSSSESHTEFQIVVFSPRIDLCHLSPETVYTVSVSAMTEIGEGPYSLPLTFQTNRSGMSVSVHGNLCVCNKHVKRLYLLVTCTYIYMYIRR